MMTCVNNNFNKHTTDLTEYINNVQECNENMANLLQISSPKVSEKTSNLQWNRFSYGYSRSYDFVTASGKRIKKQIQNTNTLKLNIITSLNNEIKTTKQKALSENRLIASKVLSIVTITAIVVSILALPLIIVAVGMAVAPVSSVIIGIGTVLLVISAMAASVVLLSLPFSSIAHLCCGGMPRDPFDNSVWKKIFPGDEVLIWDMIATYKPLQKVFHSFLSNLNKTPQEREMYNKKLSNLKERIRSVEQVPFDAYNMRKQLHVWEARVAKQEINKFEKELIANLSKL